MTPTLETPRLLLRPLELADAKQIQEIFPHREIVRYLATQVPWPYPPDGTYIRDIALPAIERGETWQWTLRLKTASAQVTGCIDLRIKENDNRGFWLGLSWQRQGFMTEACNAATDFWFETLKFPVLRAPKAIQRSLAPHLRKTTYAHHRRRRARLRLRPLSSGNLADHCGRMARLKEPLIWFSIFYLTFVYRMLYLPSSLLCLPTLFVPTAP